MKITGFQGIKPRTSPRLLGASVAQIASNTNLSSGEARPLSLPKLSYVPSATLKPGPHLAMYKADQLTLTTDLWFTWPFDVDVCRSPLPGTVKWVYSGDGEPRITTAALAQTGGGDNYPASARSLGVPKPQTAPTVVKTAAGAATTTVNRYYAYTFYDDYNQESAFSPLSALVTGEIDDSWAITAMDAAPVSSGGISNVTYVGTTVTVTVTQHFNRVGEQITIAGVTTVAGVNSPANGTWTLTATTTTTLVFVVATLPTGTYNNATDTTDTWARKAIWGACTKRLYRTAGTKAQFQLVAKDLAGTSYTDTLLDKDILGDEAITATWELPPVDLKGVMTLPSGALCGFSGNEICFSEPFQPHAWPPEYRMRTEHPVVAVGLFSSGVVVGTTGTPSVILGHEPGQMSAQPVTGAYPCLSKRSMVAMGDSVGYATAHGYARIGDSGVSLMTQDWYTRDGWANLAPATMIGETVRGRLYLMTQGVGPKLLIFDYLDGTGLTTADLDAVELFADALTGKLYIGDRATKDVREFDPNDGVYMAQDWMSREIIEANPINLGAARVNLESRWSSEQYDALVATYNAAVAANVALLATGDVGGELGGDELLLYAVGGSGITEVVAPATEAPGVTFTLYVDGVVYYSRVVTSKTGFVLPSGYKSDTFAVRVQGQSLVKSIDLAETLIGLKGA